MLYFQLDRGNIASFPKRQIRRKAEAQSQWVPMIAGDSRVAEENNEEFNPKVLPLGFLFGGEEKMREPRVYQEETAYYITVRAGNRELLFKDEGDYLSFMEILKSRKEKYNFKLYGYCLLPGHYHLLLEPAKEGADISKIMQALNTSYTLYYNKKYNRIGHLVSGRFKNKLFSRDERLLHQTVYLHLNPVRLSLVQKSEDYKWSSYPEYLGVVSQAIIDTLPISGGGVPEKYRELVEELEVVRTPGVAQTSAAKKEYKKIGYSLVLAGLIAAFIILPQLNMRDGSLSNLKSVPVQGTVSRLAQEPSLVSLPEGLPIYIGKAQGEKQAWELWKLGPQE